MHTCPTTPGPRWTKAGEPTGAMLLFVLYHQVAEIMCDCWDDVELEELLAIKAKRKEALPIVQEFEEPIVVEAR